MSTEKPEETTPSVAPIVGLLIFWIMTATLSFFGGLQVQKQRAVDADVGEWKSDKRGNVEFHYKGVQNGGQAK